MVGEDTVWRALGARPGRPGRWVDVDRQFL